jgi:ABC-type transport system involved in multi-copper enzyme maturation permease subunit
MNQILAVAGVVIRELYRRKDFYVLFILTALITVLLGSINFFNEDHVVRYLQEVVLLLIWISALVMAITTAARQIPNEIESRTLFPLLAKPISRTRVVLGKFVGCWLACGAALALFYAFFVVISVARQPTFPLATCLQAFWMHWTMLAIVTAFTLFGSLVFEAPSSNTTITLIVALAILFVGQHLQKVAVQLPSPSSLILSTAYFALPHLEFYDLRSLIIHDWPARDWGMIGLATLYGAVYTSLLLAAACAIFRRKRLAQ